MVDHWSGKTARLAAYLALILLLSACGSAPSPSPASARPGPAAPADEAVANSVRYRIRADLSEIRFLVYRAGALARLGHNHVIQARDIDGEIRLAPDIRQSSFFLSLPVKAFHVDAPDALQEEGAEFSSEPDEAAVAGTTRNMLGERVLDAARFAAVEIRSVSLKGPVWGMDITVRIRLRGVEREMVVPAAVEIERDRLRVGAFFSIRQTDFGIEPLSVLGGALQVADTVRVRMRLVADR